MICITNCPRIPPANRRSDMCETCESYRSDDKNGHDTFLAIDYGYRMTEGQPLWFCSRECFEMSPVPTIDDGLWPELP